MMREIIQAGVLEKKTRICLEKIRNKDAERWK